MQGEEIKREYDRNMFPKVWSSFSKVIVAALGILESGSRVTLHGQSVIVDMI